MVELGEEFQVGFSAMALENGFIFGDATMGEFRKLFIQMQDLHEEQEAASNLVKNQNIQLELIRTKPILYQSKTVGMVTLTLRVTCLGPMQLAEDLNLIILQTRQRQHNFKSNETLAKIPRTPESV